jgi:acetyl-CoA C-acetyltransferase
MKMLERDVYICDFVRTPHGKFFGALKDIPTAQLGGVVIKELVARNAGEFYAEDVDGVFMGQVLTAGEGQNPARHAALYGGLPVDCPAETFNKVCSSSMVALRHATNMIRLGEADCMIAGGMENMSRAPYLLRKEKKQTGDKSFGSIYVESAVNIAHHIAHDSMIYDGLTEPSQEKRPHMGELAGMCAKYHDISRFDQEEYAHQSCVRLWEVFEKGILNSQITCVNLEDGRQLKRDEVIRTPDRKLLSDIPQIPGWGTVTAGTSSKIADGASALLLASEDSIDEYYLKRLAKVHRFAVASHDPLWYTTAPSKAIGELLHEANMKVSQIDLFEVNEASAVVPICTMNNCGIPPEKMNVWGGSIGLGHPLGSTGSRVVGNLALQLEHFDKKFGIAVTCNGGGEAAAVLIERV